MAILERILTCGITGSGKSYQWIKLAEKLLPTGAIFRVLDTDNAIGYMLETKFPHLMPENKGNVYICNVYDWPHYRLGMKWALHRPIKDEDLAGLNGNLRKVYNTPIKPNDWIVVDMIDNAWKTVQNYFTTQVFEEDMGDYFLEIRKEVHARGEKDIKGKPVQTIAREAFDGWKDWVVMNRLYDDWILPLIYTIPCHLYAAAKVEQIDRGEKDAEILTLFGDVGVRPTGQKHLGHQMHTLLLYIPGKDKWFVTTLKDRAGRSYFTKIPLTSFYMQYLVAKAGWPLL